MTKKIQMDRRGSGPMFFVAVALLIYAVYSLAIAGVTADNECSESQGREWQIFPPAWECTGRPGRG